MGSLMVPFTMYNEPENIIRKVRCDVFELVQTFQATPTKEDLLTSLLFFSKLPTKIPVSFILEFLPWVAQVIVASQLSFLSIHFYNIYQAN